MSFFFLLFLFESGITHSIVLTSCGGINQAVLCFALRVGCMLRFGVIDELASL